MSTVALAAPPLPPASQEPVEFTKVQPILAAHCSKCHGNERQEGGLRIDRPSALATGGDSGAAIVAGKSAESRLVQYVAGQNPDYLMPPEGEGEKLTAAEIALVRAWIDQGAKFPAETAGGGATKSGGKHWAFQPIVRPRPPALRSAALRRNPIDEFILARLERQGIAPSPEADRVTLIRRLSFDLLGLPPTVAEIDQFLNDSRADAYEQLVDRLLASPHYGERWGRAWLDAARYADSDGYNADSARSIWKYRDWVIDSLNRDQPFDQFTIEQIAGDLLPGATIEQKIATGFHRNTLLNLEGGNDPEEYRVERVVDRVSTTGTVFLGLTVGCAECHAHKFDPISQREFYQFYAFFNTADEPALELPTPAQSAARAAVRAEIDRLQAELKAYDAQAELRKREREERIAYSAVRAAQEPFRFAARSLVVLAESQLDEKATRQEWLDKVDVLNKSMPKVLTSLVMGEAATPRETRIHIRGSFLRKGDVVQPGVPAVLPALQNKGRATRLDLARWLVSPENPLTARVLVNRVWQAYFGLGFVETENDFGTQGSPPTHPQLLDWLASEFMSPTLTPGAWPWSQKALHRLIVTSATYRQSSYARTDLASVDPRNLLLARQVRQRLDAEGVRDATLAASGLLSRKIGGPSVFPYQPDGVMSLRRSRTTWTMSDGEDRYRRGMYTHFWRTSPHPFLIAFDAPKAEATCTRRTRSNTPMQALVLLNDPPFVECARSLAGRVLEQSSPSDAERSRVMFRTALGREPSPREQGRLLALAAEQLAGFQADRAAAGQLAGQIPAGLEVETFAAWTAVARVILNLDEFITRE